MSENRRRYARAPAHAPARNIVIKLEEFDNHGDVIDALSLAAFLEGREPWSRTTTLHRVRPEATLRPPGSQPARQATVRGEVTALAVGDGWTCYSTRDRDGEATVTVSAATRELLDKVFAESTDGAEAPEAPNDEAISVGFWHAGGRDFSRRVRQIDIAPWPDIRRNYSHRVASAMNRIMAIGPDSLTGRLLLFHGPPGTGKTTVLRSLAHSWRAWCQVDYVLDPEQLLSSPPYLMAVAMDDDDRADPLPWRLLLLEDCDELIHADAKQRSGQSLARLLNLTDGLLGQGLRLLVGITTNEPLARLHPAVVRPGRCIAQVEVGRLSPTEARAWLGRPAPVGADGATLAELYALRGELTTVEELAPAAAGGTYL